MPVSAREYSLSFFWHAVAPPRVSATTGTKAIHFLFMFDTSLAREFECWRREESARCMPPPRVNTAPVFTADERPATCSFAARGRFFSKV